MEVVILGVIVLFMAIGASTYVVAFLFGEILSDKSLSLLYKAVCVLVCILLFIAEVLFLNIFYNIVLHNHM